MSQIETIAFAGTVVEILVTGEETRRQFSLLRITNPPGVWTPSHRHLHEEETIYVLAGQVQVESRGRDLVAIRRRPKSPAPGRGSPPGQRRP